MRLVDTHNHLDFPDFDADRAALLQRSRALGVERQVVLGVYRENWQRVWDLAQAEDGLYAALGLHPVYLARHRPQHLDDLRQWLQRLRGETKLCAVGEIGLDYYLEHLDRDAQQALFEAQLRLAAEFRLPALIHVRRAHAATIATLKRIRLERRGIIHAFAGSNRLRKVAAELPADAIVLETDAPDMAPSMHPGQRNSPEHLPDICRALAKLRGVDAEELAASSSRNAAELFGWD
ncbi:TatD family hydrolase [Pseudomonas aeruginosa]|uniref:TatD family hydrolase n=1 Tax=Pseudomonas aeruginosa TaxID=287 RepID=UPI00104E0186|nr:TatD family hydrolase [Pseudomonas aeruginosa]